MYVKKEAAGEPFRTNLQIMQNLLETAKSEFNIVGKTFLWKDSEDNRGNVREQ